jgi:hypothetical protein
MQRVKGWWLSESACLKLGELAEGKLQLADVPSKAKRHCTCRLHSQINHHAPVPIA